MDDEVNEANQPLLAPATESFSSIKIWPLIFHIRRDIKEVLDTALSWDQLTASDVNFTIVRPLVLKYASLKNMATVFAFLVVRGHLLSSAEGDLAHAHVKISQANLCELLAIKMLRHFAHNPIELVAVLTVNWNPLSGAPPDVVNAVRHRLGGHDEDLNDPASAIEMAIATESKRFLATPLAQTVVNDIYTGRVVYSVFSTRSLIADNYKQRQIEIYDPKKAPFLDHYRLRVPKYGAILEFMNFTFLLLTFLLCLSNKKFDRINLYELVFMVFAFGLTLGEYAACREHGWQIYIASMWNGFDIAFICIFLTYFGLRMKGLASENDHLSELAFDIMSCGACILFPRLAFFAISNNVVILALRGMIAEFLFFIVIAAICFSGLLFTLWDLAGGAWSVKDTAWLMLQIWFGNTSLSFNTAKSFHDTFGPPLMVTYSALANTLLITILISTLSNTFARIDQHANQEYLFQFAITTVEGVKSDALFSYQPPFNILAFILLGPLSLVASPRAFHSFNVFLIRLTSFPILAAISIYERYLAPGRHFFESSKYRATTFFNRLPRNIKTVPIVEALVGASGTELLEAIFEVDVHDHELEPLFSREEDFFERAQILTQNSDRGRSRASSVPGRGRPSSLGPKHDPGILQQQEGLKLIPSPNPQITKTPGSPTPGASGGGNGQAQSIHSAQEANRLRKRSKTPAQRPHSIAQPFGLLPSFDEDEPPESSFRSPLARLFSSAARRPPRPIDFGPSNAAAEDTLIEIKKLEGMIEGLKNDGGMTKKLRADLNELQQRQARIETLLMTLTRGMRGDSSSGS